MSTGISSPEKRFYDARNRQQAGQPIATIDERRMEIRTPGTRYFCVVDFLRSPRDLSAIEWGFGDIARCAALSEIFGSYRALDISASTIVAGRPLPFSWSDADLNEDLPFPNGAFDVSLAMMVIEHLFDPFHSFSEIARTTRRGGYALINLPLISSIKNRVKVALGDLPMTSSADWWRDEEWDGGHLHYFTIHYVQRLGEKYGLRLVRLYPVGKCFALKRVMPSLLCHEASFVFCRE